jgi:hypothetical protein
VCPGAAARLPTFPAVVIVYAMFVTAVTMVARWVWWTVSAPWKVVGFYRENGPAATVTVATVWLFGLGVLTLWGLAVAAQV